MPTDFDFSVGDSDMEIGIELEYPGMNTGDEYLVSRGRDTSGIQSEVHRTPFEGDPVYDGTVGLEIVSPRLQLEDAPQWYAEAIDWVEDEWGTRHQPVGLMERGSTAGLHLHLSPLTEEEARRLYDISTSPWAQVMFCSSIAIDGGAVTWPVFRGGRHCQMEYSVGNRYACVNRRSERRGHYEWRLPEPMTKDHIPVLVEFLRAFEQSPDEAIRYAQDRLDEGDERITSIKRAEAVGIDIDTVPSVERSMAAADPENFYDRVSDRYWLPEIYRVEYDGDVFYTFETRLEGEFELDGIMFTSNSILWADTLDEVSDPTLADEVRRVFERRGEQAERETEATQELKKIIKKKKGKT